MFLLSEIGARNAPSRSTTPLHPNMSDIMERTTTENLFLGSYEEYDNTSNPMETCVLGDRDESFFELDD